MEFFHFLFNSSCNNGYQQKQMLKHINRKQFKFLSDFADDFFKEKIHLPDEEFYKIYKTQQRNVLDFIYQIGFEEETTGLYLSQNVRPVKVIAEIAFKYKKPKKESKKEEEKEKQKGEEEEEKDKNNETHSQAVSGARGNMEQSEEQEQLYSEKCLSPDSGPSSPEYSSFSSSSGEESDDEEEEEEEEE